MINLFEYVGIPLIALFFTILMHECGHLSALIAMRKEWSLSLKWRKFGIAYNREEVTSNQSFWLHFWGVFAGAIFLLPIIWRDFTANIAIPLYFLGCRKDFKVMWNDISNMRRRKQQR